MTAIGRIETNRERPVGARRIEMWVWRTPDGKVVVESRGGRIATTYVPSDLETVLRLDMVPEPTELERLEWDLASEEDDTQRRVLGLAIAAIKAGLAA